MSEKRNESIPFSKKRWPRVIALIALIIAGILIALPYAISYSLERWLLNNGAQSAEIKKVRLNLFAGTAEISGLEIKLDDNVVLGDDDISINIGLSSLFKQQGYLQTGSLSGLVLDIELSEDGTLRVGSVSTPPSPPPLEAGPEAEKNVKPADGGWIFGIGYLELTDCLVRFTMPRLQKEIYVEHAVLSNLSTGSREQPAHLEMTGRINDTPLSIELDRIGLGNGVSTAGRIKIDGYKMAYLQELLEDGLDTFTGSVSLDGKIQFSRNNKGEIAAQYNGPVELAEINVGNSDFSVKSPSITYNGVVLYEQDADLNMIIDVDGLLQGTDAAVGIPAAELDLLEEQLQIDGKTRVTISKDIDVTVATDAGLTLGTFTLDLPPMKITNSSLDWQGHVEYTLPGGPGSQTVAVNGKAVLQKPGYAMKSPDFTTHIKTEELSWQGKVDIDLGNDQSPVTIQTDGVLAAAGHQMDIPDLLQLKEDSLVVDGTTEISIGKNIKVAHSGRKLQIDNTSISAAGTTSSGSLSWQGKAGYLLAGDTSTVSLDGTLKGTDLESLLEEQNIRIGQQELSINAGKVSLEIGKQIKLKGKASLQADTLLVESDGSPLVQLEKTDVKGLSGTAEGGVKVESVVLSNLEVPATDNQPITVTVPAITFSDLSSADFSKVTIAGLEIKEPTVRDSKNNTLLAQIDSVSGKNIKADADATVSLASLSTGKGTFLKKEGQKHKPQATLAKLDVNTVSWSPDDGLFVDTIALDSLFARYDKVKSPPAKKQTAQPAKKKEKKQEDATAAPAGTAAMPMQINSIVLTGKSALRFTDKTLTTPFLATLALQTVEAKNINSKKPDSPMSFALKGKIDKYAPLDISGTATPFAKDLMVDAKIELRNYSMQLLSPYVTDAIGTKFNKGQLNLTSDLKIKKGHLDLENHLVFQDIEAETVREELLEKLNNELPVSLDLALTMLRDRNGDIDLSVPLTGPLEDLSVNPTDIIVTALSKAIGVAVTPYLAYTVLGPAGALAYVGMKAGQAMLDTNFPTLEFDNGATELTEAHKEKLKKVGEILEDHKDKDYSICSKVLLWELSGDMERNFDNQQKILKDKEARKKLLLIGGARAENVQQYLLQEFSINKEHLLICSPNIDFEPDGKPRVGFRE